MEKLEEPRNRLKSIGAEVLAFSQSNKFATKIVKLIGFDPAGAGKAIDTIVRQLGTNIEERDENYKKLDRALKFRIGKSGKFYDPRKSE